MQANLAVDVDVLQPACTHDRILPKTVQEHMVSSL